MSGEVLMDGSLSVVVAGHVLRHVARSIVGLNKAKGTRSGGVTRKGLARDLQFSWPQSALNCTLPKHS